MLSVVNRENGAEREMPSLVLGNVNFTKVIFRPINPLAPEPLVTARVEPRLFYRL